MQNDIVTWTADKNPIKAQSEEVLTILKIITILWFIFSTLLSHMPGKPSGAESKWLSHVTGVNEGKLRRAAHVVCVGVLAVLLMVGFSTTPLWLRIVVLVVWAFLDELTKIWIPGRHYSTFDVIMNLCGVGAGVGVGTVIGLLIR